MRVIALLSPAKTLDESPRAITGHATVPLLLEQTQKLAATLRGYSEKKLATLMDISPKLAALNHSRYQNFTLPFTPYNAKQAVYLFRGDVYDGLDVDSLKEMEVLQLNQHVRILSGLYGLLKPLDLIQPYRLEMGTKLRTPHNKDLYQFWGDTLTQSLNAEQPELLINLASQEYFSVIQPSALTAPLLHIHFKERKGKQLKTIGLFAKKARGMMARFIAQKPLKTASDLQRFTLGGYQFDESLSDEYHYTFTR